MRRRIVERLVGYPIEWRLGQERITRVRDALRWRIASACGWDAHVDYGGRVRVSITVRW